MITVARLNRNKGHRFALAAMRRAVSLEPDNWRHYFRLSYVSWGEERLRAARRTLALLPGFPLAVTERQKALREMARQETALSAAFETAAAQSSAAHTTPPPAMRPATAGNRSRVEAAGLWLGL